MVNVIILALNVVLVLKLLAIVNVIALAPVVVMNVPVDANVIANVIPPALLMNVIQTVLQGDALITAIVVKKGVIYE